MKRLRFLVLVALLSSPALGQDGWFLPNPRKLRVPYNGSNSEAHQVKRATENLLPGLTVLTDKRSGALLFEAEPGRIEQLKAALSKLRLLTESITRK